MCFTAPVFGIFNILVLYWHLGLGVVLCSSLSIWIAGDGNKFGERLQHRNVKAIEAEQGKQAAVAADDGRCSKVGLSILKMGGHAVDAAVATALCLGVVNPVSSGIGGGAFMLVRSASTSEVEAIDMRETAPLAASKVQLYLFNISFSTSFSQHGFSL